MLDLDIIKEIEIELRTKLEELDKIKWNSKGYTLNNNGQVIALSLYDCEITNLLPIIPWLKGLISLTFLNLDVNKINDISPLQEITKLTSLNLSWNQLTDITPLKDLADLKQLYLATNQISDITALQGLKNLTELYIGQNNIKDISPLQGLKELRILDLFSNKISDITPLKEIKNLRKVDLANNSIEKLPEWFFEFHLEIKDKGNYNYISLYNNPLVEPPLDIVNQGKSAIRNYFEQLKDQDVDYLFEAKMLIVGEPGAFSEKLYFP